MTEKNANTEIHKEYCPNCEAETPCTHEAELFVCDICGEDFAKYIVLRNCNLPDVSVTQDVTTPELPEDALQARIAELEQAVGLITTLKPTMVMDAEHPLEMAKEVAEYVTARIAELEAAQRWIPVSERLPEDGETVFVIIHDGFERFEKGNEVARLTYLGNGNWWSWESERYVATHWMPLPELPERENER